MDTEQQLIKEAWDVQNACNLSGIVYSFARAMDKLCEIAREQNKGTEWKNKHLVCKLYASKIQSLSGDVPLELPEYLFS